MIVPKSNGGSMGGGNVVPMARPSETQLLMALAEMHRQGRFQTDEAEKMPFIDPEAAVKRGYGTPAEGYAWARKQGMTRDQAREWVEQNQKSMQEFEEQGLAPAEAIEKWKKSAPSGDPKI